MICHSNRLEQTFSIFHVMWEKWPASKPTVNQRYSSKFLSHNLFCPSFFVCCSSCMHFFLIVRCPSMIWNKEKKVSMHAAIVPEPTSCKRYNVATHELKASSSLRPPDVSKRADRLAPFGCESSRLISGPVVAATAEQMRELSFLTSWASARLDF